MGIPTRWSLLVVALGIAQVTTVALAWNGPIRVPKDFQTVAQATAVARAGDEIVVEPGTYPGRFWLRNGVTVRSVRPSDPETVAQTRINGRVWVVAAGPSDATLLDGLTISGVDLGTDSGGGIWVEAGRVTIRDCVVENNSALVGGGILIGCSEQQTDVSVENCHIRNNQSRNGGGGVSVRGGKVRFEGCTIEGNRNVGADWNYMNRPAAADFAGSAGLAPEHGGGSGGGGLSCTSSRVTVSDTVVRGNTTTWGEAGGAASRGGGGISSYMSALSISGCTIEGNSGPEGGGISSVEMGGLGEQQLTINDSTIARNTGRIGGGIYVDSRAEIANCCIWSNAAKESGGGVRVSGTKGVRLLNNTICGNSAPEGGGVFGERLWIWNCIIAFSWSGGGVRPLQADRTRPQDWAMDYCDLYANLISKDGGVEQPSVYGFHNISVDPLFADAPGADFHLRSRGGRWDPVKEAWVTDEADSPCIDAGDPKAEFSMEPMPNGRRVNMGAYGNTEEASKSAP